MTALPTKNLLERQVDLTRIVLVLRRGMGPHLSSRVMPHLSDEERDIVGNLVKILGEEEAIDENFAYSLDAALVEIRRAIAAGTSEEKIAIPRERLIGCAEAFETRKTLTSAAEALRDAVPPLERLHRGTREALDFAEASRVSLPMFDPD